MNKKNLFIIASPLQLVNAMEAVYYFKTSYNILIVMYNSSLNSIDFNQKINLLDIEEWDEIVYYDLGKIAKKKRFFKQVELIKKLRKDEYNYLFSGDFGTIQKAIMANVNVENIYLLDDGTASIMIYETLKNEHFFNKIPFFKKIKLLRYLLMNLRYQIKQNINYFTIYHLSSLPHMNVIQHDFSFLKKTKLQECIKTKTIYILGQNLVEVGFIKEEIYLKYLKKIIENYDGKIIYKPHRSEKVTDSYLSLVSENFLIDTEINQGPVEITFLNNKIYPSIVISFFSSALFSLDKIFENTLIYSVKIDEKDLIKKHNNVEVINSCYAFLKNTNVKDIDICGDAPQVLN